MLGRNTTPAPIQDSQVAPPLASAGGSDLKFRLAFPAATVLFAIATACSVLFFFEPGRYGFYPRCLFHQMTGLLCPGCGSLRAMHQLLHGHLLEALHLNALFVLAFPAVCWLAGRSAIRALNGQPASPGFQSHWFWTFLIVCALFGVLRNLPFAHAYWLAP